MSKPMLEMVQGNKKVVAPLSTWVIALYCVLTESQRENCMALVEQWKDVPDKDFMLAPGKEVPHAV